MRNEFYEMIIYSELRNINTINNDYDNFSIPFFHDILSFSLMLIHCHPSDLLF